ncbi:hypothetical protein Thimo_3534 [Thioflavicoccus mobilis 8321]|uniref:Uncharacterized protein n=1 Tax=Thioflavicoccus mobilis 8321 TaxID=765912 RepID=L0GZL5_9GAMM|nr:hypothetical protein Thimo_3534 [Thioflavicoccus mobilis 8321]
MALQTGVRYLPTRMRHFNCVYILNRDYSKIRRPLFLIRETLEKRHPPRPNKQHAAHAMLQTLHLNACVASLEVAR